MIDWTPTDYTDNPSFTIGILSSVYRDFALKVHKLWPMLGRQPAPDVSRNPLRHSLIQTRHPFVVPGMAPAQDSAVR